MVDVNVWVGSNIRGAWKATGLSQFQLAERSGLSADFNGKVERGAPTQRSRISRPSPRRCSLPSAMSLRENREPTQPVAGGLSMAHDDPPAFAPVAHAQATVLVLWCVGMVLACSCALATVGTCMATWLGRQAQMSRHPLRECWYEVAGQQGAPRPPLLVAPVAEAWAHVQAQSAAYLADTGWRDGQPRAGLWAAVTAGVTGFVMQRFRRAKVAQELLRERFGRWWVTDR